MRDNHQKIKLLKLMELLQQETDEQHPMRTSQVCQRLNEMGISCERRTVARDMSLLNEQGYEVMCVQIGHEKAYYVADRTFDAPELQVLIDAVQAASFITPAKTDALVRKIAALGGSHCAEILTGGMVRFNNRKHSNEAIFYTIDAIRQAIQLQRQLSFLYFDLDEHHARVYRKERRRYVVEPITAVLNDDNYYVVCYSSKYHTLNNYRVDRISDVMLEDEPISPEAKAQQLDAAVYTEQVFKMFNGELQRVSLEFDDSVMGAVYDKFGEDLTVSRVDEHTCAASLMVRVSPAFFGWMFTFAGKMRLTSPRGLMHRYRELAEQVAAEHTLPAGGQG